MVQLIHKSLAGFAIACSEDVIILQVVAVRHVIRVSTKISCHMYGKIWGKSNYQFTLKNMILGVVI